MVAQLSAAQLPPAQGVKCSLATNLDWKVPCTRCGRAGHAKSKCKVISEPPTKAQTFGLLRPPYPGLFDLRGVETDHPGSRLAQFTHPGSARLRKGSHPGSALGRVPVHPGSVVYLQITPGLSGTVGRNWGGHRPPVSLFLGSQCLALIDTFRPWI